MAILTHAVGAAPVDVGDALNLDGDRVFENVGDRPLRFVVGSAPGEAAPVDLLDGHLLRPGERETVGTAAGTPVWVWSVYPTRLGVGPAWQVAAGVGGGGAGLRMRVPADIFAGANRGAAEAARNAGLDAGDLAEFDADVNLAIILRIGGADTYQVRRAAAWRDVTNVVRGPGPTDAQLDGRLRAMSARASGSAIVFELGGAEVFRLSEANVKSLLDNLGVTYD